MARKFETADIVTPVKARLRGDSFTHINGAFDELSNAVIKKMLNAYTTNDVIVLNGCVMTGTLVAPGPAAITAGQVFYNGRIYEVDAVASLVLAGAQIPVFTIVETQQGGQTTFSDANDYDFQTIEKFAMTAGLSGSGASGTTSTNVANAKFLKKTKRLSIGAWDMDANADKSVAHGLSAVEWIKAVVVSGSIIKDDLARFDVLPINNATSGAATGIRYVDSTNIELTRNTGGQFDHVDYNDVSISRGYVDIMYGDI